MKILLPMATLSLLAAACSNAVAPGNPDAGSVNPPRLWLAPDGSELQVKLIGSEPPGY